MNPNPEATGGAAALLCIACGSEIAAESGPGEVACPTCGRVHKPEASVQPAGLNDSPDSIFALPDASAASSLSSETPAPTSAAAPCETSTVDATGADAALLGSPRFEDGELVAIPSQSLAALPRTRLKPRIPLSIWMIAILVPYCAASSIGMWLLYQQLKTAQRHQGTPNTDPEAAPVATHGTLKLGETRRLGNILEITPVEARRMRGLRYSFPANQGIHAGDVVALRLRVRNLSPGILRPLLPMFNQRHDAALTWMEIHGVKYYGPSEDAALERFEGQEFNELLPNQSMETLVFAARSLDGKLIDDALKEAGDELKLRWQVALYRHRSDPLGRDALNNVVLIFVELRKSELK